MPISDAPAIGGRSLRSPPCVLALALLAACHSGPADREAASGDGGDGRISCKPAGAADYAPVCTVERTAGQDGLVLTIHHPDGAFRRLLVTRDGRGVIAADGAEPAVVRVTGADRIEVALGGDSYRLPATVRGDGQAGR